MLKINELMMIYLGNQGENLARTIQIDVNDWLIGHPNAAISIWHKPNGVSEASATGATLDRTTGIVTWAPLTSDTGHAGAGEAEVRLTENNVLKKSRKIVTLVSPAVTLDGSTIGSGWQAYIDAIDALKTAVIAALNQAEAWAYGTINGVPIPETNEAYNKNAKYLADQAGAAYGAELTAEAWATGKRNGQDVPESDPTHDNNAAYYATQAHNDAQSVAQAAQSIENAEAAAAAAEAAAEAAAQAAVGLYMDEDGDMCQADPEEET